MHTYEAIEIKEIRGKVENTYGTLCVERYDVLISS